LKDEFLGRVSNISEEGFSVLTEGNFDRGVYRVNKRSIEHLKKHDVRIKTKVISFSTPLNSMPSYNSREVQMKLTSKPKFSRNEA
jgi:hypothetical protein